MHFNLLIPFLLLIVPGCINASNPKELYEVAYGDFIRESSLADDTYVKFLEEKTTMPMSDSKKVYYRDLTMVGLVYGMAVFDTEFLKDQLSEVKLSKADKEILIKNFKKVITEENVNNGYLINTEHNSRLVDLAFDLQHGVVLFAVLYPD